MLAASAAVRRARFDTIRILVFCQQFIVSE